MPRPLRVVVSILWCAAVAAIVFRPDAVLASRKSQRTPPALVTTATTEAPAGSTYVHRAKEPFLPGWFDRWGLTRPWRTAVIAEAGGNTFLRVGIVAGSHSGTSFRLPMPSAEFAHLRYRVRFGPTFDPSKAAANVKQPGFGNPVFGAKGVCLAACGNAPADGVTSYSARSDIHQDGTPGWYVYDVDAARVLDFGRGERWSVPAFRGGRWYMVDQYIRMNTPGQNDGRLAVLVDGVEVHDRSTYNFRTVPTLGVGAAWFDVHYGGSGVAPVDMWVDYDDVLMEWG